GGDHHEVGARIDGRRVGLDVGVVEAAEDVVGDAGGGEVRVAAHTAEAGEVLAGDGDAGSTQPAHERGAVIGHGLRVAAKLPAPEADRIVVLLGACGHGVEHRGEVEVDAGEVEIYAPQERVLLQLGGIDLTLVERGWHD